MRNVVLTGYMGAGKTTLGMSLSRLTSMQFLDLDWMIESRFHKRIPDMFAEEGEEMFRKREHNMLMEVLDYENVIIATGGGAPCWFDNMEQMNEKAETVFLNCEVESIIEHLHISKTRRPLLEGKSDEELKKFIKDNLQERMPYYTQAKHIINIPTLRTREQIEKNAKKIAEICNLSVNHSS